MTLYDIRNYSTSCLPSTLHANDDSADENETTTHQLEPSSVDLDTEIKKWINLILTSPFLQIENPHWPSYVNMLRKVNSKPFAALVIETVCCHYIL